MSEPETPSRRRLLLSLGLVPLAALGSQSSREGSTTAELPPTEPYRPAFFNLTEWAFLLAACERLIPPDEHGPSALEAGAPEFIDRHMQTPYAAGDIWYLQGPFLEAPPQFGYQGRLSVRDILRVGMKAVDGYCAKTYSGKTFAQLEHGDQESLLKIAEADQLPLEDISAKLFFDQLLSETRLGYFCDPIHGGNKQMAAWKMIGYPGMRADYTDWVEVRDQAYPLPPVDLAGRRG